jgi:hypothetical protein
VLEASKPNAKATLESSSIKFTWTIGFIVFFLEFKTHNYGKLQCIKKKLMAADLVQNTSIHK